MKKIGLILIVILALVQISGCENNINNSDLAPINSYQKGEEEKAIQYEKEYLTTDSDEDLVKLCSQLNSMSIEQPQFYKMVITYYPLLFNRFTDNQISGGLNAYYARYIATSVYQNSGDLETLYKNYKDRTKNIYNYASCVYDYVLRLENLSDPDCKFLYNEAHGLYEQAKKDDADKQSRYDACYCIIQICKKMGVEVDADILAEMKEYLENN